jgi:photosystem II stability/assembly factor-like uncharacterized protein
MKKILLFWILTMLLFAGGRTWAQVELLPNTPNDTYFCAAHPVPGIVYLAGDQAVYKSYDNGDSWGTVFAFDSSFSSRFFGMWFRDEQTGFATCAKNGKSAAALMTSDLLDAPLLYKTVDGGVSWQCIDSAHAFSDVQFVSQNILFAREQSEGALYKSVDGGNSWANMLDGMDLSDYFVVDGQLVYALHGASYISDPEVTTAPDPIVYKSSDGGVSWTVIRPADSSKGPRVMDQIYFYEEGKGVVFGHDQMFTEDDFSTYEMVGSGFPSAPEGWSFQNSTLRSGFQMATSWNHFDMSGNSLVLISRDYGRHRKTATADHSFNFMCGVSGCDADTTFIIVTWNDVFRAKGSDFPNVGVPERPAMQTRVHPNPTDNLLSVELSNGAEIANAVLYDMQGRIVETRHGASLQGGTATLSLNSVPAGVYVLRVTDTEGREYHRKVVKR